MCQGAISTVPCNSKNMESCSVGCGAGVGTTGAGAYLYSPVFPQGLSVTRVIEGVKVLCVSEAVPVPAQPLGGLPTCIPPEPRAPGLLRPLRSGAVRVNHCFLRRVLETRQCGGLDRAVSTQLPPQAWSPWWSRRSDRDRGAPSVFLASLLPGAYVSPEASFPPPRSWRCQGRRGRDSGNFLEVRQ